MPKHQFTPSERYAVFTVHGEVCYLCKQPIDMGSYQVDHVLPEQLENDPDRLEEVMAEFGIDDGFELNSFENWMPACVECNNNKRAAVFEPVPIFLRELGKPRNKADRAREIEAEVRTSRQIGRALAVLEGAQQKGSLEGRHLERIRPLIDFHEAHREPDRVDKPLHLGPQIEVLARDGENLTIRGPFGVGVGRVHPPMGGNWDCSVCGHSAWNGTRCVVCGTMDCD